MPNTHISVLLERPIDQYKQTHLGDFGLAGATGRTALLEVLLLFAEPPPPCGAPRTASFVNASVRFIILCACVTILYKGGGWTSELGT